MGAFGGILRVSLGVTNQPRPKSARALLPVAELARERSPAFVLPLFFKKNTGVTGGSFWESTGSRQSLAEGGSFSCLFYLAVLGAGLEGAAPLARRF